MRQRLHEKVDLNSVPNISTVRWSSFTTLLFRPPGRC